MHKLTSYGLSQPEVDGNINDECKRCFSLSPFFHVYSDWICIKTQENKKKESGFHLYVAYIHLLPYIYYRAKL